MAGFLEPFSKDTSISYPYARQLNVIHKGFVGHAIQNFSHNALKELLTAPEELKEDFLSFEEPVKVKGMNDCQIIFVGNSAVALDGSKQSNFLFWIYEWSLTQTNFLFWIYEWVAGQSNSFGYES